MLQHVLVPLDGSALAQSALDHALKVLGEGGQITLVTVLEPQEIALSEFYPSTIIPRSNEDENSTYAAIARAQSYLKRVAADMEEELGIAGYTRVEVGDAATVITDIAENLHVDAIVMSTHGRSGLSRWLFGSVTQKVLAAATCPVLVIPAKTREEIKSRELVTEPFLVSVPLSASRDEQCGLNPGTAHRIICFRFCTILCASNFLQPRL